MKAPLLTAALLLCAGGARATECVFYLKPAGRSFETRVFDPSADRDVASPLGPVPGPEIVWDDSFERAWWLDGRQVHSAWWLGKGKPRWPVPLPEGLSKPAAWWLDWRGLKAVRRETEKLELWEHVGAKRSWRVAERERLLEPASRDRQAAAKLREWSAGRRDKPLARLLAAMQGAAHLSEVRWTGAPGAQTASIPFYGETGCGLKVQVEKDDAGERVAAPLLHSCDAQGMARLVYGSSVTAGSSPVAFAEAAPWLLVGGGPDVRDARIFSLKDGSLRKALPAGASHAVWLACPARPGRD